jgi:hypothetical protein
MRKNLLIIHLFYSIIILLCSCNFPYQPKQFVLPEIPYKFPASQTIKAFADNAKKVKCAYSLMEGGSRWLYFVDFNDTSPHPIKLKKPTDKKDMHADSPIISPDGTFAAYYMTEGGAMVNGAYIQKLDSLSDPVLVAADGTEPHWWISAEGETFIIYSDNIFISGPLSVNKGKTYKKKVMLAADGSLSEEPATTIAPYPMNGGLSADGQILCTGYERSAFYDIANAQLTPINSDPVAFQVCNPSIDPDSAHPDWMMFLNFSGKQSLINPFSKSSDYPADASGIVGMHAVLFIVDISNIVKDFIPIGIMGGAYVGWQDPEWSNDPRFAAALAMIDDSRADFVIIKNIGDRDAKKETLVLTIGTGKLNETSTPSIWINR